MADALYEFTYSAGPQVAVPACSVVDLIEGEKVYGPEGLEFTAGFTKGSKAPKDAVAGLTPATLQAREKGSTAKPSPEESDE